VPSRYWLSISNEGTNKNSHSICSPLLYWTQVTIQPCAVTAVRVVRRHESSSEPVAEYSKTQPAKGSGRANEWLAAVRQAGGAAVSRVPTDRAPRPAAPSTNRPMQPTNRRNCSEFATESDAGEAPHEPAIPFAATGVPATSRPGPAGLPRPRPATPTARRGVRPHVGRRTLSASPGLPSRTYYTPRAAGAPTRSHARRRGCPVRVRAARRLRSQPAGHTSASRSVEVTHRPPAIERNCGAF